MDADKLRALLAVLTEAGVRRATFDPWAKGLTEVGLTEVEFGSTSQLVPPKVVTTFTDPKTGEPVDLDEGASELADESVDAAIVAKNFTSGTG